MTDVHSEIAKAQQPRSIAAYIQQLQPEIARALPKGMDPDRIARLALTVVRQSEMAKRKGTAKTSLADCTPESFAAALLTAVAFGLEPGVDGEAWLVPYGKECTFIPGYKGIAKLYWQHPLARHLDAQAVYENDDFDYELGLHPSLRHKPAMGDRGKKITHYYAVASLSTGAEKFEVMTAEQVAAVRDASPRRSNDIRDPQHWMERKTVLKQLLKVMPKSTRLQQVLVADEQTGTELRAEQMPAQVMQTNPAAIEYVPSDVDPTTGEVIDHDQLVSEADSARAGMNRMADAMLDTSVSETSPSNDARGAGSPDSVPPSGGTEAGQVAGDRQSGERRTAPAQSDRGPVDDPTPGEGLGEEPEPEVVDRPKITTKQRAALMARWSELGVQRSDRAERLLITCTLLGLEPGALKSTSDLASEDASQLLEVLSTITDRDDLDRRLAGQQTAI